MFVSSTFTDLTVPVYDRNRGFSIRNIFVNSSFLFLENKLLKQLLSNKNEKYVSDTKSYSPNIYGCVNYDNPCEIQCSRKT